MASPWAPASPGRSSSGCTRSSRSTRRRSSTGARSRLETGGRHPHVGWMIPTMAETGTAESLLPFPCVFPLKVMGRREDGFAQLVCDVVMRHAPDFNAGTIEMRTSKNGRYLSLTVTLNAKSREQLDALYSELSKHPMVMMVL